jgi:hypothetical protein
VYQIDNAPTTRQSIDRLHSRLYFFTCEMLLLNTPIFIQLQKFMVLNFLTWAKISSTYITVGMKDAATAK